MSLASKLRRITLDRQGLLKSNHFGRGKNATLRAIEQLGYVQIDTISVVERAHHHVIWSRVANYRPQFLEQLVRERKLFEYWSHAAAWLPMSDYRFALPRMRKLNGERDWFESCDRKLQREIIKRIEIEGPLRARDFEDPKHRSDGWWEWKPAKQALEQLFMQGELMVSGRDGFQKVYDLPERVLPDWVDTREPDIDEYAEHLIDSTLRAHGFASQATMTYLRKGQQLRAAVRHGLEARIESEKLVTVDPGNGAEVYIDPEVLESRAPRSTAQVRILSPFDNAIIQRQRGREVFGFDYQIECYLPEARREYGYFCLPVLYRDRFIGRIDCKAHRKNGQLEVKAMHLEDVPDETFDLAFAQALEAFASFNGCQHISGACRT
ncbi:MAG: YcaQ family DNA glycosylase [Gammaproteobacteria bacterium]|nr:MAG: winged helix-turn-helix domain-containing protein [Gammaproteobacteria bacterium]UCH38938.1 MAG: YcaQ family DNA glycosylase [Gammaproteobacteria bacterium]